MNKVDRKYITQFPQQSSFFTCSLNETIACEFNKLID